MHHVSLPFLPLASALSMATPRIISFSPSFLAVAQERFSLHSTRRIPLAFGASSYAFTRTRRFPFLSWFASLLSLSHRVLRSILLPSGSFRHLSYTFLLFLYRSHVTPNYPDVTGAAQRLFQANSRDFPKIYRSTLVKLAAERL